MPAGSNSGSIDISTIKYNWRGEWATSGIYSKNDVVRYKGRTYYCKVDDLYDQNLYGVEFGPGKVMGLSGEMLVPTARQPITWNLSSNMQMAGQSPSNTALGTHPQRSLISKIKKNVTATAAWDGGAYSTEFYTKSAHLVFTANDVSMTGMIGLNSDPATDASYASIDYAWYMSNGTALIYEGGSQVGTSYGSYTQTTQFAITYDGKTIRYWKDNVVIRTVDRPIGAALYVDSSVYAAGNAFSNISFGPGNVSPYWAEHTEGYLYRGGWMAYRQYYPGDVVKLRGDVYICKIANFNGHPIYKNGNFTTDPTVNNNPDWKKIVSGTHSTDDDYVEVLPNFPPLGWTKFRGSQFEPGNQRSPIRARFFTASGKSYVVGQGDTSRANGSGISGENGGPWMATPAMNLTFDHWDYRFGRLPGFQGQPPKCIQLIGNDYFGKALFDNGELYSWGYNGHGQCGNGTNGDMSYPVRCGYVNGTHDYRNSGTGAGYLANTRIVKIACMDNAQDDASHSIAALDSTGQLWTWGYNGYGQLGHGDTSDRNIPTLLDPKYFDNNTIVDVWSNASSNYTAFMAIDSVGTLWAWGYNGYGQLGTGNTRNEMRPVPVKYNWNAFGGIKKIQFQGKGTMGATAVLTNDGTLHACGRMSYTDMAGPGLHSLGYITTFRPYPNIVKGYAKATGQNYTQQGANIEVCHNVDDFWVIGSYSGDENTIIVKEKNTGLLYGWGYNYANCLMITSSALLISNDSGGYNDTRQYYPMPIPLSAPDLTFVGRCGINGYRTIYWITESGKAYASGHNESGSAGWGFQGYNAPANNFYVGMNDWDSMGSTETPANRTWLGMRQTDRISVIGGACCDATGGSQGSFAVTEGGVLQYVGYHNTYAKAGHNRWGVENIGSTGGKAPTSYYISRAGLSPFESLTKVIY